MDIHKILLRDIRTLIGYWFAALEDEGADPWSMPECIAWAAKYGYTKADYQKYLNTIC